MGGGPRCLPGSSIRQHHRATHMATGCTLAVPNTKHTEKYSGIPVAICMSFVRVPSDLSKSPADMFRFRQAVRLQARCKLHFPSHMRHLRSRSCYIGPPVRLAGAWLMFIVSTAKSNSDVGVHQCRDGADGSGTMLGTGEMWLARGAAHNPAALMVHY